MPNFDAKSFNPQAFKYLVERVPNLTMNELKKSKALAGNPDIRAIFTSQNGTAYARLAMRGLIDGDAVNYDGQTDITATSTKTFEQGVVVVGRAKAWTEKDFSYDITGGVDFMENVAQQVAQYKDELDQNTVLAVLKGIFTMTGSKNAEFVKKHTYDATAIGTGAMSATTLNTATNKACGANKKKFTLIFVHSDVATNLENLNLLAHLKYTDKDGITRDLDMGTWNGKTVVIDDAMPTESGFYAANADTENALKVIASGTPTANEVLLKTVKDSAFYPDGNAAEQYVVAGARYVSYVLGAGAIAYEDIGAKVPHEMARDPKVNGGEDTLYMRQRKCFAPYGISYEKKSQTSLSPTDTELSDGSNWSLVHSGETDESKRSYFNHKAIAIARILSRG